MQRKSGFTLLELIVVIIIIGILATLGFVQYTAIIEKGRRAEAASNLGTLRTLESVRYQETGAYGDLASLNSGLPGGATASCGAVSPANQYYFQYECASASGTCTAHRCTTGGKAPVGTSADTMTLGIDGTKGGSVTW